MARRQVATPGLSAEAVKDAVAARTAAAAATPEGHEPVSQAATPPRVGGHLVAGGTAEVTELDPQLTAGTARQRVTMLTYNNLLKLGADLSIKPDLAESWKVSEDGLQIAFTLRQGVRWHPPVNRELVADDVKFSYERLLKESPGRADFAAIASIEVVDKYRLNFLLNAPNAGLLAAMADSRWGAIVCREMVEKHGDLRTAAVGTGPFILESWVAGEGGRYRRNPDYFERGKPLLDGLTIRTFPDEASMLSALQGRAIHHAMFEGLPGVEVPAAEAGFIVHRSPRLAYDFLSFNQKVFPFDRPQVIQAINCAIDREECIKVATRGLATLTAPCLVPMKQWQLPPSEWEPYYKVDLDRARRLLAEAGLPGGFQATALTIPALPTMFANAQVVQSNLKRIGIDLRIESLDYGDWLRRWQARDFQATFNSTAGSADPDLLLYRAFHSRGQNWNNLENPELDRLLDQGRAVVEIDRRKPIYDEVQRILLERPGHLFLFVPRMVDVTTTSVRGFWQHPTSALSSYQDVWLDG